MDPHDALAGKLLLNRARRAYESGRLSSSLLTSVWLTPVLGLPILCCSDPIGSLISAVGLILVVTFCLWRGGAWRRGVKPGLIAGLVPMLTPFLMQTGNHVCMGGRCYLFPGMCIFAGIVGGVALGLLAPRPRDGQVVPLFAASMIAGLAGAVGCLVYGFIGVGGMIFGLLAGAAPVLVTRRTRS